MQTPSPAFARDAATAAYYDQRAQEYDDWYEGVGRFADRDRPGWAAELDEVVELVRGLPPAHTLDVACGSGYLTQHVQGVVMGLDQSLPMVEVAKARVPHGQVVVGSALALPFADRAFERVLAGHFYGHLPDDERRLFLAESARTAPELVVIDSALRPGVSEAQWQERVLNDGSRHRVYKRFLTGEQLAAEIDGEVLSDGSWFVAARCLRR